MIVLGLHFGHDASVSVVRDGEVLVCLQRERVNRIKHAMSLAAEDVNLCLRDVGLAPSDVDYCAITSSQMVEYIFEDRHSLAISLAPHRRHDLPCTLTDELGIDPDAMLQSSSGWVADICSGRNDQFDRQSIPNFYRFLMPGVDEIVSDPSNLLGSFEQFILAEPWAEVTRLPHIAGTDYSRHITRDTARFGFHYPATLRLSGERIPAYLFAHHYAHLAYAFYSSPFDESAVFSHDGAGGGMGCGCGMFAYGRGNKLFPLTPHHLALGELYDMTAFKLGFGALNGAGKLMGLAGYGKPRFLVPEFVGNWFDAGRPSAVDWVEHCNAAAKALGYDLKPLADPEQMLAPINVDIAASTQALAEQILMQAVEALFAVVRKSAGDVSNVCLSGGTALNCPANARIAAHGPFEEVFVPPAVSDEGLSIGSALALYHNLLDRERTANGEVTPSLAYLGLTDSSSMEAVLDALQQRSSEIAVEQVADTGAAAARALHENKIVAWVEGRSEIGPRALGHRSLLANPRYEENWKRVNTIKQREHWRPLAPAVLQEEAGSCLEDTGMGSVFMLLNSKVVSEQIPAVTHVDGSARAQTVSRECGEFYTLLKAFHALEGIPVVLNTSLNVRGEPIVETASDAVSFLLKTTVDVLFFPGFAVTRA